MKKAQTGDKIKLIGDLCHNTIFGLVTMPKGTELEVDYRTSKDNGVETKKYVKLHTNYGVKEVKVRVYDSEYEIVE